MSKQTDLINIPDVITFDGSNNVSIGASPSSSSTVKIQNTNDNTHNTLDLFNDNGNRTFTFQQDSTGNAKVILQKNDGTNAVRLDANLGGILFGTDTAAANALDDYEEGTFEPTIIGTSSSPTVTYQADNGGSYTKIGRVVYYTGCVRWTALSGGSGTARIGNLPFTSASRTNGDNADSIGSARTSIWNGTSSKHPTIIGMVAGNTTLTLIANSSTGTAATLQVSDLGTTCSFQFTCIAYV